MSISKKLFGKMPNGKEVILHLKAKLDNYTIDTESNVINLMYENFNSNQTVIKSININGINGSIIPIIRPYEGASEEKYKYVPEYLTLPYDSQVIRDSIVFEKI